MYSMFQVSAVAASLTRKDWEIAHVLDAHEPMFRRASAAALLQLSKGGGYCAATLIVQGQIRASAMAPYNRSNRRFAVYSHRVLGHVACARSIDCGILVQSVLR